ncbi:Uncharacterized protein Adt_45512 [Abeliophyllum distichum]|uniref:Uncharacterized protein n=1 Tax=Abeliophyllum distichum TaxID=126358 RepID=A0ABD1PDW3_9LAMI
MSPSRSNNKSKRKTTFRRSSVAQKRNRRKSKARNKPQKKFTVMVKEGKKAVASTSHTASVVETVKELVTQRDPDPRSLQKSQNVGHKGGCGRSLVNTTPIKKLMLTIMIYTATISVNLIEHLSQNNRIMVLLRSISINSQIKKSTKHTNRTSQAAKSCPKIPRQVETSKAEALKKRFDVVMSTHEKLVADHFILKM